MLPDLKFEQACQPVQKLAVEFLCLLIGNRRIPGLHRSVPEMLWKLTEVRYLIDRPGSLQYEITISVKDRLVHRNEFFSGFDVQSIKNNAQRHVLFIFYEFYFLINDPFDIYTINRLQCPAHAGGYLIIL